MSFTPKTWGTGDTVYPSDLTRIEQGIADGGGYDLVVEYDDSTATCTVVSGDILDAEAKMDSGGIVNGIALIKSEWSWTPSTANSNRSVIYAPLTIFDGPYTAICFCATYGTGTSNSVRVANLKIMYDYETGAITNHIAQILDK